MMHSTGRQLYHDYGDERFAGVDVMDHPVEVLCLDSIVHQATSMLACLAHQDVVQSGLISVTLSNDTTQQPDLPSWSHARRADLACSLWSSLSLAVSMPTSSM